MDLVNVILRIVAFIVGAVLIIAALRSSVLTFVLPRLGRSYITRWLFLGMRLIFNMIANRRKDYAGRDSIMALYAPVTLLILPATWLGITLVGFAGIFWAFGIPTIGKLFCESGSALLNARLRRPARRADHCSIAGRSDNWPHPGRSSDRVPAYYVFGVLQARDAGDAP